MAHRTIAMCHLFPFENPMTLTVMTSKSPVLESLPTMIIMPKRRARAPSSIHWITFCRSGASSSASRSASMMKGRAMHENRA
mgnify:CR=1 FL=1